MDRAQFWNLIDSVRLECLNTTFGQTRKFAWRFHDLLDQKLSALPPEQVVLFDKILIELLEESYDNLLWGIYYIASEWNNPDRFTYFRGFMVAMGERYFMSIINSPESIMHGQDFYFADHIGKVIITAGNWAYLNATGKEHPSPASSYNRSGKPIGEPVTSEFLNRLRVKNTALTGREYNIYPYQNSPLLNIPLSQELTDQLKGMAWNWGKSFEGMVQQVVDELETQHIRSEQMLFDELTTIPGFDTQNPLLMIAQAADQLGDSSELQNTAEFSREILRLEFPEFLMRRMREEKGEFDEQDSD